MTWLFVECDMRGVCMREKRDKKIKSTRGRHIYALCMCRAFYPQCCEEGGLDEFPYPGRVRGKERGFD